MSRGRTLLASQTRTLRNLGRTSLARGLREVSSGVPSPWTWAMRRRGSIDCGLATTLRIDPHRGARDPFAPIPSPHRFGHGPISRRPAGPAGDDFERVTFEEFLTDPRASGKVLTRTLPRLVHLLLRLHRLLHLTRQACAPSSKPASDSSTPAFALQACRAVAVS